MKKNLLKFIVLVFFLHFGNSAFAQFNGIAKNKLSSTLSPQTLNLDVRMIDSVEKCVFTLQPLNFGNYKFKVIGGEDSNLLNQTLSIYLGQFEFFKFDSPLRMGWCGNIRVVRTWMDFSPFIFYQLDHVYEPGELFTHEHQLLYFGR